MVLSSTSVVKALSGSHSALALAPSNDSDTAETTERTQGARWGQLVPAERLGGRVGSDGLTGVSERVVVMGGLTRRVRDTISGREVVVVREVWTLTSRKKQRCYICTSSSSQRGHAVIFKSHCDEPGALVRLSLILNCILEKETTTSPASA